MNMDESKVSWIVAVFWTALVVSGVGCSGEADDSEPTGGLEVQVRTPDGESIEGAPVEVAGESAETDAEGRVMIDGLSAGEALVRAEADGHAPATTFAEVAAETMSVATVRLAEVDTVEAFAAESGGTIESGNLRVDIPASAVADSQGNPVEGEVDLTIADTQAADGGEAVVPGPTDRVRSDGDGSGAAMLRPEQLASISLSRDGESLQIAEGETIEISAPLSEQNTGEYREGDTIGAYWYDEQAGEWVRDGEAEVVESEGELRWVAEVSHLTWWGMCKQVEDFDCLDVTVETPDGSPVASAYVAANGLTSPARSTGSTGQNGRACTQFLAGAKVRLEVLPPTQYGDQRVTREVQGEGRGAACTRGGGADCRSVTVTVEDRGDDGGGDEDAGMGNEDAGGGGAGGQTSERIAASGGHGCLVRSSGRVTCWGKNDSGQLGDGSTTTPSGAVRVEGLESAAAVSVGHRSTCAVTDGGAVSCWGANNYGEVGDGTTDSRSTPTEVLTGAAQVDVGKGHTCAVMEDGTAKCWGKNSFGQLGDGSSTQQTSPVEVQGLSGVADVASGSSRTVAVLNSGAVRAWGFGLIGGGRNKGQNNVPVTVDGISTATRVAIGYEHACAVLQDGGVTCWGINDDGQLGRGSVAEGVTGYEPEEVNGIDNAVDVAAGSDHSCALLESGKVSCWGARDKGQVGDGTEDVAADPTPTPVDVSGISDAVGISADAQATCILNGAHEVWCWGSYSDATPRQVSL